MPCKWRVYIVECGDGTLYTGVTNDIDARIKAHNEGLGAKYTRCRLPVKLLYSENKRNRSTASKREAAIKAMTRGEKLKLAHK